MRKTILIQSKKLIGVHQENERIVYTNQPSRDMLGARRQSRSSSAEFAIRGMLQALSRPGKQYETRCSTLLDYSIRFSAMQLCSLHSSSLLLSIEQTSDAAMVHVYTCIDIYI